MVREAEFGVVEGNETSSTKFRHGLPQVLRHVVDLAPVGVVLAVFHDGEVDVGKLHPETFETTAVAAIA